MNYKKTNRMWKNITPENKKIIESYLEFRNNNNKASTTVKNESNTLRKLARFLGDKSLKDATQDNLETFFGDKTIVKNWNSRDLYGAHISKFYNRIFKLRRKQRPEIMDWFEYQSADQRDKNHDPDAYEKFFIRPEEYKKLIASTIDPQEKALWQTMYLTGPRPSEACSMRIGGLKEVTGGYEITVYDSKTKKRKIPISDTPEHLLYWIRNHPYKNNPDSSLWLSQSKRKMFNPMNKDAIGFKLKKAIIRSGIKNTITPHCFRKTRASIMFNADIGNDDKLMSEFFGWKLHTVVERRKEYDLRPHETLRKKIFNSKTHLEPSYDALKIEKERAESQAKKIEDMEETMSQMKSLIDQLMKATTGEPSTL